MFIHSCLLIFLYLLCYLYFHLMFWAIIFLCFTQFKIDCSLEFRYILWHKSLLACVQLSPPLSGFFWGEGAAVHRLSSFKGWVEGWGQIAFRGKLKSSCSLAWKLGVMSIKSEWVIKRCPKALNIQFRIALWNLSRALKNLDSLENYNSRQFLLVNLFGGVPPERTRRSVFFQHFFRPGL